MDTVEESVGRRDGAALKAMAQDGNAEAAIAFADLVFGAKYGGDLTIHKTKKAAKDEAREDAPRLVVQAGEAGSHAALEKAADMYFMSVWEPGNFGSLILPASYKIAMGFYQRLIEAEGLSDEQKALYHCRLGLCYFFRNRVKDSTDPEHRQMVIDSWEAARQFPETESAKTATHCLSDLYHREGRYKESFDLAESIADTRPWAQMTLALAYKHGRGVDQDMDKFQRHYQAFLTMSGSKKKKK